MQTSQQRRQGRSARAAEAHAARRERAGEGVKGGWACKPPFSDRTCAHCTRTHAPRVQVFRKRQFGKRARAQTYKRASWARFLTSTGGELGIRRAAGAALLPLRACGACGLRWKTAPPFPQLRTPNGVRIHGAATKKRASWARFLISTGGELGIRTPEGLCGPYSLSRRAPSASRSALRNSQTIITHFRGLDQGAEATIQN